MKIYKKNINKKVLAGSIGVVVILIGVSFSTVVGYSSVNQIFGKASPLFTIRTNRAIGKEDKVLTTYAHKEALLPFPKRDDKAVLTQKVIDSIRQMDDKTFDKFISSIIVSAQKDGRLNIINLNEIRETLYLIINSEKTLPIFATDIKQLASFAPGIPCPLTQGDCPVTFNGIEGILICFLGLLLLPFIIIIKFLLWCGNPNLAVSSLIHTCNCQPSEPITLRKLLP